MGLHQSSTGKWSFWPIGDFREDFTATPCLCKRSESEPGNRIYLAPNLGLRNHLNPYQLPQLRQGPKSNVHFNCKGGEQSTTTDRYGAYGPCRYGYPEWTIRSRGTIHAGWLSPVP